jgi:hypothetical protein
METPNVSTAIASTAHVKQKKQMAIISRGTDSFAWSPIDSMTGEPE